MYDVIFMYYYFNYNYHHHNDHHLIITTHAHSLTLQPKYLQHATISRQTTENQNL